MTRLEVDLRCQLPKFTLRVQAEWEGQALGIFGPSGSGKSTLLEHLMGLRRDATGRLELDRRTLLDSSRGTWIAPEERRIGYVPQDGLLYPHWSVQGNLLLGKRRRSLSEGKRQRLDDLVELLDLSGLLEAPVTALSGGERRRVALARALLRDPVLVCMDEPLTNIDAARRQSILAHLIGLQKWSGVPIVLVSHDATDLLALTTHTWRLEQGQVVESGPTWQVLARQPSLAVPENAPRNLLSATLVGREGHHVRVRLDCGVELHGICREANVGDPVAIGLSPTEILLSRELPRGISAQNRLPARIVERHQSSTTGLLVLCELSPDTPPLWVLVTDQADRDLHLRPGGDIFLVFKASSCLVEPLRRPAQS